MRGSKRSEPARLTGRHIFITGGTGFLGRSLLDYLDESARFHGADFRSTVLTRTPQQFLDRHPKYSSCKWLNFIAGDMCEFPRPTTTVTDLIHAAADTHERGFAKTDWFDQIADGTRRVLDFARDQHVDRLLFISSGAVYGKQPSYQSALAEDWPHAPLPTDASSVYGTAKRTAEHLCALYAAEYNMNCVIARCFAIISEHMPLHGPYAAGNFLRDAMDRDTIRVRGNGEAIRTYLDGRDTAHWLVTLLRNGSTGHAYNVGSDVAISMLELAHRIGHLLAPGKPVVVENALLNGPQSIYVPDITKARSMGLVIETDLDTAIRDAAKGVLGAKHSG